MTSLPASRSAAFFGRAAGLPGSRHGRRRGRPDHRTGAGQRARRRGVDGRLHQPVADPGAPAAGPEPDVDLVEYGVPPGGAAALRRRADHASPAAPPASRSEAIALSVATWRRIGSPGYPFDLARSSGWPARRTTGATTRPAGPGSSRPSWARPIGPRRSATVTVPTLVLHGEADPLIGVSGGAATAAAIPGARLVTFPAWDTTCRKRCGRGSSRRSPRVTADGASRSAAEQRAPDGMRTYSCMSEPDCPTSPTERQALAQPRRRSRPRPGPGRRRRRDQPAPVRRRRPAGRPPSRT